MRRARLTTPRAAGVAFLWFIGVVRDRLGEHEDQLFSTVFLGSGLLYLAMLFASAGMTGGLITACGGSPAAVVTSGSYAFGRAVTQEIINIYAIEMAGVFMISTCTLFVRTKVMPRWMALLGYALALALLLSIGYVSWISLVFPLWVLLLSIYICLNHQLDRDCRPRDRISWPATIESSLTAKRS